MKHANPLDLNKIVRKDKHVMNYDILLNSVNIDLLKEIIEKQLLPSLGLYSMSYKKALDNSIFAVHQILHIYFPYFSYN